MWNNFYIEESGGGTLYNTRGKGRERERGVLQGKAGMSIGLRSVFTGVLCGRRVMCPLCGCLLASVYSVKFCVLDT